MNQRIIKFRAFLGVDKVMVGVNEIDFEHKTFSFIHPEYGAARHTIGGDGDVLMQFTGLHDKNGLQDVYECDIIDEYGNIKGNIYEMDKGETDFVIEGFRTATWAETEKTGLGRGLIYPKRDASKIPFW